MQGAKSEGMMPYLMVLVCFVGKVPQSHPSYADEKLPAATLCVSFSLDRFCVQCGILVTQSADIDTAV